MPWCHLKMPCLQELIYDEINCALFAKIMLAYFLHNPQFCKCDWREWLIGLLYKKWHGTYFFIKLFFYFDSHFFLKYVQKVVKGGHLKS